MIVDEEVYLEHFGVKGMRWGVRKNNKTDDNQNDNKSNRNRNIKVAATIAIGALFVSGFLIKNGKTKVHDYGYSYPTTDIGPMGLGNVRFGPNT